MHVTVNYKINMTTASESHKKQIGPELNTPSPGLEACPDILKNSWVKTGKVRLATAQDPNAFTVVTSSAVRQTWGLLQFCGWQMNTARFNGFLAEKLKKPTNNSSILTFRAVIVDQHRLLQDGYSFVANHNGSHVQGCCQLTHNFCCNLAKRSVVVHILEHCDVQYCASSPERIWDEGSSSQIKAEQTELRSRKHIGIVSRHTASHALPLSISQEENLEISLLMQPNGTKKKRRYIVRLNSLDPNEPEISKQEAVVSERKITQNVAFTVLSDSGSLQIMMSQYESWSPFINVEGPNV